MLVAIDVGNTQTVIGLFAPGDGPAGSSAELLHHWRIATVASRTADEMALLIDQLFQLQGLDPAETITGIAVASVVPRPADRPAGDERPVVQGRDGHRRARRPDRACRSTTTTPRRSAPTASPTRWPPSSATAGPTIVVDFGTATTFEVVSAKGEYLGGHHRARHRDLPGGPVRPGPPCCPGSSWSSPAACWPRTPSSPSSRASSTASRPRSTGCAGGSRTSSVRARWWPPAAWPASSVPTRRRSSTTSRG